MGSFSWMKADTLTRVANICEGKPFKFLIPKEFGGGYIKDYYQDYGLLGTKENGEPKYDIYEVLAFWNAPQYPKVLESLQYDGEYPLMKEIDEYTDDNRGAMGFDMDVINWKYPPKLVSCSFKGTYEDCDGFSFYDPNQGFWETKRTVENSFPYLYQQEKDVQMIEEFVAKLHFELFERAKASISITKFDDSYNFEVSTELWNIALRNGHKFDWYLNRSHLKADEVGATGGDKTIIAVGFNW